MLLVSNPSELSSSTIDPSTHGARSHGFRMGQDLQVSQLDSSERPTLWSLVHAREDETLLPPLVCTILARLADNRLSGVGKERIQIISEACSFLLIEVRVMSQLARFFWATTRLLGDRSRRGKSAIDDRKIQTSFQGTAHIIMGEEWPRNDADSLESSPLNLSKWDLLGDRKLTCSS